MLQGRYNLSSPIMPAVGFEPTKLSHSILSATPLTTRENRLNAPAWVRTKDLVVNSHTL